ncbi:MAG: CDP-glucose 4,6-dehydratase, partial [Sedimentisphaerales bacterium]|nr:CDP-glucose 4,6-dehydratase [Sedimentisphaerales bacterium]
MFNGIYQGKKVLITGNTGFKGSWLTCWLLNLGADVYGISHDIPTQPSMFEALGLEAKIRHYKNDIRDYAVIDEIIKESRPDYIFHLAAQPIVSVSYKEPLDTFGTNILGTVSILDALRQIDHRCTAVMITSDKCYDNVEWRWGYRETDHLGGKDPYSASKAAAEMAIKSYYHSYFKNNSQVRLASVRAGNVIGGGDWAASRIVPDCFRAWAGGQPVTIRSPHSTRPWQHVLEPLSGYLTVGQILAESPEYSGEAYNFGPAAEQTHTVLELLMEISNYWNAGGCKDKFIIDQNNDFHEAGLLKLNCDKALFDLKWLATLNFNQLA